MARGASPTPAPTQREALPAFPMPMGLSPMWQSSLGRTRSGSESSASRPAITGGGPLTGDSTAYVIGPERFKAALAFVYSQTCGLKSPMAAPTLVINGVSVSERAETCPVQSANATSGGAPAEERVAPQLFKNFEPNSPMPDKANFPQWLASSPEHAAAAADQAREFFARHLKP